MDSLPSHAGLEYVLGRVVQDFMRFMRRTGLSMPQVHALVHIYHSPDRECQLAEIGGLTASSKAAASQLVERLVQQGLVERAEDPRDRRNTKLRLTAKSLKLIQEAMASDHFLMELMTALPAGQRETVHAAFGYLARAGEQIRPMQARKEVKHDA
jgi:DNA-binding MarR family transcriptional regulator